MRIKLIAASLAVAMALPLAMVASTVASATDVGRSDRKYRKYERYQVAKRRYYRGDENYAWRAANADPTGQYKGYPDWARVALSPRFDRGWR